MHLASLRRAKAIRTAIFFPRLHGENVSGEGQRFFLHWDSLLIWEFRIMHFIEQPVTLWGCGIFTEFLCFSQGDAQKGEPGERGPEVCMQLEYLPKM